ncbi:MAG: hypothetical protein LBH85_01235 [Treponema sp.]|jgi:hypothetical protein|nr:hypothetical protein [Treponema sp.]
MERLLVKLGSVKTWVALWCMGILTYLAAADRLDNGVASILASAMVAFIGANVAQKKIEADRAHETRTRDKGGDI